MTPHALTDIRVIDVTDDLGAYAGRLLVDLGAEVVRIEPPGGSSTRKQHPLVDVDGTTISAYDAFVNAGKRSVVIDATSPADRATLERLLGTADIVIQSPGASLETFGVDVDRLHELNPGVGNVVVSPFGEGATGAPEPADDLLVMAAGGLLHLGGYPDLGPRVAYGGQSRFAASIFAAVAAIVAVLERDRGERGGDYDVSAQECIAQALEDSASTYALTGHVRERQGDRPREAGSGIYPRADGHVSMIAGRLGTARAWTALVGWLNEAQSPGADELLAPEWTSFEYRQSEAAIERFGELFAAFAKTRTKQELYAEAQRRMIALSPVSTIDDVLANEQLRHRGFFTEVSLGSRSAVFPRAPYRLSATPASDPRPAPGLGDADDGLVAGLAVGSLS